MAPNLSTLRPLIAGDVIIATKPVVHIVDNENKHKYCDNCLKHCGKDLFTLPTSDHSILKKCSNCRQMSYCDRKCQKNDWKYHKKECKVLANKMFRPEEVKPVERLLIRLWLIIKSDETFAAKKYQLFNGSDITLNDIEVNVKELCEDIDRLVEFELICNHFNDYELDYNRKELFHWFGLITTSPIRQEFMSFGAYCGGPLLRFEVLIAGIGLYPELYSVSHSCLPNSVVVFDGLSLQLRATEEIGVGSQITRSYVYLGRNKTDRHKSLSHKYLINGCNCLKCVQNLDSNVDYKRLDELFDWQIRESHLFWCGSSVDSRPFFSILSEIVGQIEVIATKAMGKYDPKLTEILINQILYRQYSGNCKKGEVIQQYYPRLKEHIRVTYGVNHTLYRHWDVSTIYLNVVSK